MLHLLKMAMFALIVDAFEFKANMKPQELL